MQDSEEILETPRATRKRVLTICDKINILYKLEEGVTPREVARQYNVTTSAISKIKKKKVDYLSKTSNEVSLQQKNLRITQNPALEDMIYAWLCQKICLGEIINGPIVCEKALVLNEKMNGPSTFKASNGWLHRFKRRHGIRHLTSQGDKISDTVPSEQFVNDFKKYINYNGYELVNIYNGDETGLNWKSLPKVQESLPKDRVTVMLCANALGTHKIPAFIIGKQEKPKCLSDVVRLPVIYKAQANSLMDRSLFMDWYTNHFIPSVRREQEKTGNTGRVLLLLDNAPCHSSVPILNSIDQQFSVMYLPPNVTTTLQPMDQGIIETTKNHYRKTLAIRLLLSRNVRIDEFLDNLTIMDCCEILASAWQSVPVSTLLNTWQPLMLEQSIVKNDDLGQSCTMIHDELVSTLNQIENFNVTESDVIDWLNEDNTDHGWAPLTDEQLIAEAMGHETLNVNMRFKCEPECEITEEDNEHYSAQDALTAINIVYKWYEKQQECILSDLMTLNDIRNRAMQKVVQEK